MKVILIVIFCEINSFYLIFENALKILLKFSKKEKLCRIALRLVWKIIYLNTYYSSNEYENERSFAQFAWTVSTYVFLFDYFILISSD